MSVISIRLPVCHTPVPIYVCLSVRLSRSCPHNVRLYVCLSFVCPSARLFVTFTFMSVCVCVFFISAVSQLWPSGLSVCMSHSCPMLACLFIGADFHRAMVATAPGEKLLLGRRPVRNWTQLHFLCFTVNSD